MTNPWANPLGPHAIATALRLALSGADGIEVAFIFGSLAKGDYRAESDVDVMVIGSIKGIEISRRVSRLMDTVGREINYVHYTTEELDRRLRDRNHFVLRVFESRKLFLIGDDEIVSRISGKALEGPSV